MPAYVDYVVYELIVQNGPTFDLQDFATEANFTLTKTKTPKHTLNQERKARGMTSGPLEAEGSMTAAIPVGAVQPDFYQLFEDDTIFQIRARRKGGTRIMYLDVELESVDESASSDGTVEWALTYKGLGFTNKQ